MSATKTRSENTPPDQPDASSAQDTLEQPALLKAFLATSQHCFGGFTALVQDITDPRVPELIPYPLAALGFATWLMDVCHLGARRQITHRLRSHPWSAAKFQALFGVAQCPHGDPTEALFSRLKPEEFQTTVSTMVETLIRKKSARALSVARSLLSPCHGWDGSARL